MFPTSLDMMMKQTSYHLCRHVCFCVTFFEKVHLVLLISGGSGSIILHVVLEKLLLMTTTSRMSIPSGPKRNLIQVQWEKYKDKCHRDYEVLPSWVEWRRTIWREESQRRLWWNNQKHCPVAPTQLQGQTFRRVKKRKRIWRLPKLSSPKNIIKT